MSHEMSKKQKSPVVTLLDTVWQNSLKATSHSWERLNHAMSRALKLAIGAGFEFAKDDMSTIRKNYSYGHWIGDSEYIYALMIEEGNIAAAQSYECAYGREPFIADDVDFPSWTQTCAHMASGRQRERLAVGFKFVYRGVRLTVTSFADDNSYFTACTYKPQKEGEYRSKIEKRFKLTRDDIIADRAERKEREKLLDELAKAATDETRPEITKALGIKVQSDYAKLPIEKIRKVAERTTPTTATSSEKPSPLDSNL